MSETWPNPADEKDLQVLSKEDLSWLGKLEAPLIDEDKRPLWFACVNHHASICGDLTPAGGALIMVMKYEHAPGSDFKVKGRYRSCDQCPKACRFILEVLR